MPTSETSPAHPVDAFLHEAMTTRCLVATPMADRRTLIRRASLDLLGLPPTFDEVEEFCRDDRPDAYERLIDRLLAQPQYGERWARHWLDLARFAESHGFEHDYDRRTAYHYRDFVIRALNDNRPFDQFVQWQVAGDEVAPEQQDAWMATGFLAAGVHSTQITKNEVERHRYDELDDIISTISTAMLGLTVGCARCHDHPSDPISQDDYYGLAAIFTRTVRSELPMEIDPAGDRLRQADWQHAHVPFESAVRQYEATTLVDRLRSWHVEGGAAEIRPEWIAPTVVLRTTLGEPLTRQDDGSWLWGSMGASPEAYEVDLGTSLSQITAMRLEALPHLSFKNGGPGLSPVGNFAVSEVEIRVGSGREERRLPIESVTATFEQLGHPASAVSDDDRSTAWSIDPQLGREHALVLKLAMPWTPATGERCRLRIHFADHAIGRIRVSLSSVEQPNCECGLPFPEDVWHTLQRPFASWSAAEIGNVVKWYRHRDSEWQQLDAARSAHAQTAPEPRRENVLIATEGLPPLRLHTQGADEFLPTTQVLAKGDPQRKLRPASPAVLPVLMAYGVTPTDWFPAPVVGARTLLTRRGLAAWLKDVDRGAGPLLARVCVNRLWQHHFGSGLVATPSDFGQSGARPSHPELLEWLAAELVARDWDVKAIQRLIVTTEAYRRRAVSPGSPAAEQYASRDPENRWLARWQPRRLDAEVLRDSLFAVTGQLDATMYGPGTLAEDQPRRSLYFTVKRSQPIALLRAFDAPDASLPLASRPRTVSAGQALWYLNSPLVQQLASRLAEDVSAGGSDHDRIQKLYRAVLQRDPSAREQQLAGQFIESRSDDPRNWPALAHALLCLDEFCLLE